MFWVALASAIAAVISAGIALFALRRSSLAVRRARIALVTVHSREERKYQDDHVYSVERTYVSLANDSLAPVLVRDLGFAFGQWWISDASELRLWTIDRPSGMPSDHVVRPGESVELPMPDGWDDAVSGDGIVGPVAVVIDAYGTAWRRTVKGFDLLERHVGASPSRRALWFERQPWFERANRHLTNTARNKASKHPWRLPWQVHLINVLWGWRIGPPRGLDLPENAPRTWRYVGLIGPG